MGKQLFVSKRTALTEKQQKAMDYANAETMFYENTTVCVPAQYAVDKEMKIKEKDGEKNDRSIAKSKTRILRS